VTLARCLQVYRERKPMPIVVVASRIQIAVSYSVDPAV
jgi:hypothetical protein